MKKKWMRFLLITLSIAVLTVSTAVLTGCALRFEAVVFDDVPVDMRFNFESKAFLFTNADEVENHIREYKTDAIQQPYHEKIETYDDKFFEKNSLVVLYYFDGSISSQISVKGIRYDNDVVTVLLSRKLPKYSATAVKECVVIVEMEKNEKITSAGYKVEEHVTK